MHKSKAKVICKLLMPSLLLINRDKTLEIHKHIYKHSEVYMRYKGVIFDLDGVICSTDEFHYKAWKKMANRIGIPFDRQINQRLRGVSRMASLEIILEKSQKKYSDTEKERLASEKNETYRSLLLSMTPDDLSPEVLSTLYSLKSRGLRLAIGSSSKNTKTILKQLGLSGFFDAVSDGTNITRSKPDPQVFLMAAGMIMLKPSECLVVEDAKAGIDAAAAGGFESAGIQTAADYKKSTWRLKTFSDLLEICR
jgi:beta-phosphoglucomutase